MLSGVQGSEALPAPPPARKPSERPAEALKPVQAEARSMSQAPTALHFTKKVGFCKNFRFNP